MSASDQVWVPGYTKANGVEVKGYFLDRKSGRCWEGYEPVPGKEPYSEGSCRPEQKAGRCWDGYEPTPGKEPYSEGSCQPEKKADRCWDGYEPVPGKEPYSEGSCRPEKKTMATTDGSSGSLVHPEHGQLGEDDGLERKSQTWVPGYTKADGTKVEGYFRQGGSSATGTPAIARESSGTEDLTSIARDKGLHFDQRVLAHRNITGERMEQLWMNTDSEELRGLSDGVNQWWWDAEFGTHHQMAALLGLDYSEFRDHPINTKVGRWYINDLEDVDDFVEQFETDRKSLLKSQVWVKPYTKADGTKVEGYYKQGGAGKEEAAAKQPSGQDDFIDPSSLPPMEADEGFMDFLLGKPDAMPPRQYTPKDRSKQPEKPMSHQDKVESSPQFLAWAGTDNVVRDAGPDKTSYNAGQKLRMAENSLKKLNEWFELEGSREDSINRAMKQADKWDEIKGHDGPTTPEDLEKHLEAAYNIGVMPYISTRENEKERAASHYEGKERERDKLIDEIAELEKAYSGRKFKTGQPVVAVTYHGSPSEHFDVFEDDLLGANTGAYSASQGHFFAGTPDTAYGYAGDLHDRPIPFIGYERMSGEQQRELVEEVKRAMGMEAEEFGGMAERLGIEEEDYAEYGDITDYAVRKFAYKYPELVRDLAYGILEVHESDAEFDTTVVSPSTHKVYAKFSNPYVHDQEGKGYREETYGNLMKKAKEKGHDGLIVLNTRDPGIYDDRSSYSDRDNIFAVFSGDQVKSATGNNGNFDPNDPNITKSLKKSQVWVKPYTKADGTKVEGYYKQGASAKEKPSAGGRRSKFENPRMSPGYREAKDEFFKIPHSARSAFEQMYKAGGNERQKVLSIAKEEGLDTRLIDNYFQAEEKLEEARKRRKAEQLAGPEFAHDVSGNKSSNPQVETPEFKEWFGESKIVNEDGSPRVLFHGTRADFDEFRLSEDGLVNETMGIHLAKDPKLTESFTVGTYARSDAWGEGPDAVKVRNRGERQPEMIKTGGKTLPVFVSMKNPYIMPNLGTSDQHSIMVDVFSEIFKADKDAFMHFAKTSRNATSEQAEEAYEKLSRDEPVESGPLKASADLIRDHGGGFAGLAANYSPEFGRDYQGQNWRAWAGGKYREIMKSKGYDGVVYEVTSGNEIGSDGEIDHTAYIVFDPEQIKSATGNNGNFDPNDPNITKSTLSVLETVRKRLSSSDWNGAANSACISIEGLMQDFYPQESKAMLADKSLWPSALR